MKFIKVIFLSSVLFLQLISCKDTGTGPTQKPFKDPRTMTWTVDTIQYPGSMQTLLSSIWGSSPTDVYAVGHNESNDGQIWHYDGKKWVPVDLFQYVERNGLTLQKVFGFGPGDFWVVGAKYVSAAGFEHKGTLMLQNNGLWIDHKLNYLSWIMDITGTSSRDIWACGSNGIVMNFNGYSWRVDTIKIKKFHYDTEYVLRGIAKTDNDIVLIATTSNFTLARREQYYIRGSIKNWAVVDSSIFTNENWGDNSRWGDNGIFQSSSGKIYSYGGGGVWVLDIKKNQWDQILRNNYYVNSVFGLSDDHLIATADFGKIWLYNGSVWTELSNLVPGQGQLQIYDVWTNGDEMFFLALSTNSYPMKTLILHGK